MKKNAPLAFRIPSELKKRLQQIADHEVRSISQVCEILLSIGTEAYDKEGARYLNRYLGRSKEE
jgi:predicted transcriptional regulator